MSRVDFYHLTTEGLNSSLPKLAEKIVSAGLRCLIKVEDKETATSLDKALWTYREDSFLPHAIAGNDHDGEQLLLISMDDDNSNNSNTLLMVNNARHKDISPFERVMVMFDGHDHDVVSKARELWKSFKDSSAELSYWQQKEGGGWEKKA